MLEDMGIFINPKRVNTFCSGGQLSGGGGIFFAFTQ